MGAVPRAVGFPVHERARFRASAAALAVVTLGLAPGTKTGPPSIVVKLAGKTMELPSRTTIRTLLNSADVHPRAGRLLSVQGQIIGEASPAVYLRNGTRVDADAMLRTGDAVVAQDGPDAAEPSVLESYREAAGNPQFLLSSGVVTVRRGLVSGVIEPISSAPDAGPARVALTFDDGPSPDTTPKLLDLLRDAGAKATFFVVGGAAFRHPDLVKRELAEGMVVGAHTWSHVLLAGKAAADVIDQLGHTKQFVNGLGGTVAVYRPPYGSFDEQTVQTANAIGLRTVVWSVDPHDWTRPGAGVIAQRVLEAVRPGAIVLLHDGGGDRSQTVEAVSILVRVLRERGYEFATVG